MLMKKTNKKFSYTISHKLNKTRQKTKERAVVRKTVPVQNGSPLGPCKTVPLTEESAKSFFGADSNQHS
jgi:hypothetical protein